MHEKAAAREGLGDLVISHRERVNGLCRFFQLLALKAGLLGSLFLSLAGMWESDRSRQLTLSMLAALGVAVGSVAVHCHIFRAMSAIRILRAHIAFHVVEMRELLLEHAESIAAKEERYSTR